MKTKRRSKHGQKRDLNKIHLAIGEALSEHAKLEVYLAFMVCAATGRSSKEVLASFSRMTADKKLKEINKAMRSSLDGKPELAFWASTKPVIKQLNTERNTIAHSQVQIAYLNGLDRTLCIVGPSLSYLADGRNTEALEVSDVIYFTKFTSRISFSIFGFAQYLAGINDKPEVFQIESPLAKFYKSPKFAGTIGPDIFYDDIRDHLTFHSEAEVRQGFQANPHPKDRD